MQQNHNFANMKTTVLTLVSLLATGPYLAGANTPEVVFQKTLPDGRAVIVTRTSRVEYQPPDMSQKESFPKDIIPIGGNFRISRYVMQLRDNAGVQTTVWEKEEKLIAIPEADTSQLELKILDVAAKGDDIAVLRAMKTVGIELLHKGEKGVSCIASHEFFPQSCLKLARAGQLV